MIAVVPNLFKGIAVVIDNGIELSEPEPAITRILKNISDSGGHAIKLSKLPPPEYDLEHFSRASFFIMDWNLENSPDDGAPLGIGVRLTGELNKHAIAEKIAFLKRLSKNRHAPVFIFTNEAPEKVIEELSIDEQLHRSVDESHILVKRKSDVTDNLYEILEGWAAAMPSVRTLKTWERSYLRAANELFIDLHNRDSYWPVLFWQTFGADGIPPEVEMNKLLNRLVESRMGPLDLDLEPFLETVAEQKKKDESSYRTSIYKVLEGERFLRAEKLKDHLFAPGDVFEFPVKGEERSTYFINVRPECDCARGSDELELYLLQAKPVLDAEGQINKENGNLIEKDPEAIVYAMLQGQTFSVKFKDMRIRKVKDIAKNGGVRIGRLLPPFITRVQQRYAAYMQRPGLPRIPTTMYDESAENSGSGKCMLAG